jgi:hypothetical protein
MGSGQGSFIPAIPAAQETRDQENCNVRPAQANNKTPSQPTRRHGVLLVEIRLAIQGVDSQ